VNALDKFVAKKRLADSLEKVAQEIRPGMGWRDLVPKPMRDAPAALWRSGKSMANAWGKVMPASLRSAPSTLAGAGSRSASSMGKVLRSALPGGGGKPFALPPRPKPTVQKQRVVNVRPEPVPAPKPASAPSRAWSGGYRTYSQMARDLRKKHGVNVSGSALQSWAGRELMANSRVDLGALAKAYGSSARSTAAQRGSAFQGLGKADLWNTAAGQQRLQRLNRTRRGGVPVAKPQRAQAPMKPMARRQQLRNVQPALRATAPPPTGGRSQVISDTPGSILRASRARALATRANLGQRGTRVPEMPVPRTAVAGR
jgi:hypothetical protein